MKVYDIPFSALLGHETGPYKAAYASSGWEERHSYMTVYEPMAWHGEGAPAAAFYRKRPCVILFPGGGYHLTYEGEGEPVALQLIAAGAVVIEVRYSVVDLNRMSEQALFPQPLEEGLTAVYYARTHADELGIDPRNISVMGFSAGGHVAAMTGVLWNKPVAAPFEHDVPEAYRPDKMILCYPVLSSGKYSHQSSFEFLLGPNPSPEALKTVSIELQADAKSPATFLFHNMDDSCVPPQNSLLLQLALLELGVRCEAHFFPEGGHGVSLGNYLIEERFKESECFSGWITECIRFMHT